MKKMTAILVTLCMLAALLAGCGGGDTGDKISAPFESGKCKGMELEVVKSRSCPRRGGEWRLL